MVTITHAKVVSTPDDGTSDVGSDEWNANHVVSGVRELLAANRTYYVRTDGSNSNNGLTNTAGGAWLTAQYAIDTIAATIDIGAFTVTIQFGDGTYAGPSINSVPTGTGQVVFQGNLADNTAVIFNDSVTGFSCFDLECFSFCFLESITISPTGGTAGITFDFPAIVYTHNCRFVAPVGGADRAIAFYTTGAYCWLRPGASEVVGNWNAFIAEQGLGNNSCLYQATTTITGTPAWTIACVDFSNGSVFATNGGSFSGSATGKRYTATLNGVINTAGGGANYFPGDVAGSTATGGQYA